jgi:hypothetical protein
VGGNPTLWRAAPAKDKHRRYAPDRQQASSYTVAMKPSMDGRSALSINTRKE